MGNEDLVSLQAVVHGYVQGVFFRAFVSHWANELGLSGYVRNLPGGAVEVVAEGEKGQLEKLLGYLKIGPPSAKVKRVTTTWAEYSGKYPDFSVRY
jgi:acylphosphatase